MGLHEKHVVSVWAACISTYSVVSRVTNSVVAEAADNYIRNRLPGRGLPRI